MSTEPEESYEAYVLAEMADAQDRETDPEFQFIYGAKA